MYKIYVNERPLILAHPESNFDKLLSEGTSIVTPYIGKSKQFLQYIDMFEKRGRVDEIAITHSDVKKLKKDLFSLLKIIPAGGGLVLNKRKEALVIFRRGLWDLPKGKIDIGETKKEASVREVIEETGIADAAILKKLTKTYHIYKLKSGKRALKLTYWYVMETDSTQVKPQTEEDIEKIDWVKPKDFNKSYPNSYANIQNVFQKFNEKKKFQPFWT